MEIEVKTTVSILSDSEVSQCKECVGVVGSSSGMVTTGFAMLAVAATRTAKSYGDGPNHNGVRSKISRVTPSDNVIVEGIDVANVPISEMGYIKGSDQSWLNVVNVEELSNVSSVPSQADSYEAAVAIKEYHFRCPQAYRKKIVGHRAHHPNPCSSQGALGSYYSRSNPTPST
jgi:hypothetical protein